MFSTVPEQSKVALHQLRPEYSGFLQRSIRKILDLQITRDTIAQIIDGLPTKSNFIGPPDVIDSRKHPDIEAREKATEDAYDLASAFCASLDIEAIYITAEVGRYRVTKFIERLLCDVFRQQNPFSSLWIKFSNLISAKSLVIFFMTLLAISTITTEEIYYWSLVHLCYSNSTMYKNGDASIAA